MKITRLELLKVPPSWVWLKIHTDEGIVGLGEPYLENHADVALHCPVSPLALAASIQLDASIPNFLVQEHNEVNDWREGGRTYFGVGYFRDPFVLGDDGCVDLPSKPGLGVEIDETGLARILDKPWYVERG